MKIKWEFIVIIALLLLIGGLIIFWPSKPDSQTIVNANDSIAKILEENQVNLMKARTFELSLAEHRLKATIDSGRYLREISTLRLKMLTKRTQVQLIIDTIPDLREFVQTADNVIELQRQRIDSLEADKAFQASLYNELIYIKDKQIANLEIVSSQKDIVIKDLEKQARKKRRGNRLLKIGVIALPVLALIGGSQL